MVNVIKLQHHDFTLIIKREHPIAPLFHLPTLHDQSYMYITCNFSKLSNEFEKTIY